jgi:hypothetical protein
MALSPQQQWRTFEAFLDLEGMGDVVKREVATVVEKRGSNVAVAGRGV